MSAQFNNIVYDAALEYIDDNTETLHILTGDPGVTWSNIASLGIGSKASPTINVPEDATSGRKIVIPAITDGNVTGTDTATHFALTDDTGTEILVSQALDSSQAVTSGNTFTLTEIEINIPDPA
jgi:hypothetical protein